MNDIVHLSDHPTSSRDLHHKRKLKTQNICHFCIFNPFLLPGRLFIIFPVLCLDLHALLLVCTLRKLIQSEDGDHLSGFLVFVLFDEGIGTFRYKVDKQEKELDNYWDCHIGLHYSTERGRTNICFCQNKSDYIVHQSA